MVPEGWKAYSLIDITKWSSGSTPSKSENDFWGGDIPWISAVSMKGIFYSDSDLKVTEKALKHSAKVANENDILLLVRGSMLWNKIPVGIATRAMAFNQDVKCIKADTKKVDVRFLLYWFLAKEKHLLGMVTGTGIGAGKLDTSELQSLDIYLPCLSEQKKIAKILSTWDNAIATTEKLIATSQQQKKALMQQLLTGKKRLLDDSGKPFEGEWEWLKASELFKTVSKKNNSDSEELLSVTQDQGVLPRSILERRVVMPDGSTKGYKLVVPGNFIISLRSFQGGLEYSRYRGLVSPAYTVLEPVKPINNEFYKQYYKSYNFIGHLAVAVIGIRDGKQISYSDFSFLKLPYPKVKEQQKIAAVLTNADKEIEFLEAKLAHLKEEKKALMQQLLTGKRRVKVSETEAA